jgi:hypothetical protein
MYFYGLLTSASLVTALLTWHLWRRTRDVSFPLGIAAIYFWTLLGGWLIVHDRLSPSGDLYGHWDLEYKLFAIKLDWAYFLTLVIYSCFIISILAPLLLIVRRALVDQECLIRVSHGKLLALAVCAGSGSLWITHDSLLTAMALNISGYEYTRWVVATENPLYPIHVILVLIAVYAVGFGMAVLGSNAEPRHVTADKRWWTLWAYLITLMALYTYMMLLGNRSELLRGAIFATLFYRANSRKVRWWRVGLLIGVFLFSLIAISSLRGVSADSLSDKAKSLNVFKDMLQPLLTSGEAFAGHMSLYGVVKEDVPLTYGKSFISLLASLVPRFIQPDRPEDVYQYYARSVGAMEGQGYTIHHATGWYLNFGFPGVVVGGLLVGVIWAKSFNYYGQSRPTNSVFWRALQVSAPWAVVAALPDLLRAGPEQYKSFFVEGLLLPVLVIGIGRCSAWKLAKRARASFGPQASGGTRN